MMWGKNPCDGCFHQDCCGMLAFDTSHLTEEEVFRAHCCGCPCGEGFECNRDNGCDNYTTEPD